MFALFPLVICLVDITSAQRNTNTNGFGSIFETSNTYVLSTFASLSTTLNVSRSFTTVPTSQGNLSFPAPRPTSWQSIIGSETGPACSSITGSSSTDIQTLATIEIQVGNLSGSGVISLGENAKETESAAHVTVAPSSTALSVCSLCTDDLNRPPFPMNLTNITATPSSPRSFALGTPSLQSLLNTSAGNLRRGHSSIVPAILAPLTVMALL